MYIAICDDNMIDREIIMMLLRDYFAQKSIHFDIVEYASGMDLIYDIEDERNFDIVFLDIYMDEMLGIDVAYKLRKSFNYEGNIVFLTATSEFAVESYDVNASGYLVKPISSKKVFTLMDNIILSYTPQTYPVRRYSSILHIPIDEILYIDSDNNKCIIHRKQNRLYTVYKRLDEIQEELRSSQFLRCHQSYLVNMDYIQRADKEFELTTGDIINIRQRDLKNIRSQYINYIKSRGKSFD